jgi:hypothetical protein
MKPLMTALAMTTALTAPGLAAAKPVTFTTNMSNYGGLPAYLAFYVTDSNGGFVGTMWLAGSRSRYFEHLTGWMRASGGDMSKVNGLTGASVGSGQKLTITFDLQDAFFDAGYTLHIDSASEQMRAVPNDIVVPLTAAGAGQAVQGKGFIADFTYSM